MTTTLYLAGPLFGLAERRFNSDLAGALRKLLPGWVVVVPQEEAAGLAGLPELEAEIYRGCLRCIDRCSVVVALLDGSDSDSGTCVELGYALASGKSIVGVRTDPRGHEDRGLNAMVSNCCDSLLLEPGAELDVLARLIAESVERLSVVVSQNPA